jgi:hypothetical protein
MGSFLRIYAQMVMVLRLLLASVVVISAWAQSPTERPPRFEDYPVKELFKGKPALPVLETPEERKLEALIGDGVSKGWGVFDGATGKEFRRPGPNFAGHYIIVNFGCDDTDYAASLLPAPPVAPIDPPRTSLCLGAPIVDAKTGHVYRPPAPQMNGAVWRQYFAVFAESLAPHPSASSHNFRLKSPLAYRLNSRLLIADTCEGVEASGGSIISFRSTGCGAHYYLMDVDGLTLIRRIVSDQPSIP